MVVRVPQLGDLFSGDSAFVLWAVLEMERRQHPNTDAGDVRHAGQRIPWKSAL
jgi:hypothetical protein